jgi:DNA-binding CsgD family transcriptional regulator
MVAMTSPGVEEATLRAAALQVVQHGSRASFRRRVVDAMRSVVKAPIGFFCLGTQDTLAYGDSTRVVDDGLSQITAPAGVKLTQAFGFVTGDVVATTRRAYLADELYPATERAKLTYFQNHAGSGATQAVLVFFHEGGVLFGLGGLERRAGDPPFTAADAAVIEALAPYVVAGARSQIAYDELAREACALRALGRSVGTLYVVDRDTRKVLWAADREQGIDWAQDVLPIEDALANAAQKSLESRARGEALPTPPRLANGTVAAVAKIDGDPVFGNARCAVLRVEAVDSKAPAAMEGLSRREREIARLLVAGYSGVNVAAIAGLSENTVRTYVRRLYQKLDVNNRADLVRRLMAPDPKSASGPPSSQIAPPDSSLVQGDDTLD